MANAASNSNSSDPDPRQLLERTAHLLFDQPGRVVELRALHVRGVRGKGTVSGYFDDPEKFVEGALSLDGRAEGIYAILNVIQPSLLARAYNRLVECPESTTSDLDITRRRFLLIDVDPTRPSKISSTDAELQLAYQAARAIVDDLTAWGFPAPARGCSGNGAHIVYAIDLDTNDSDLVTRFLKALAFKFNTAQVQIDVSVGKAGQLTKLYGTLARKGDALPDRPHRRSTIAVPDGGLNPVPIELLERVANTAPRVEGFASASPGAKSGPRFDVERMLREASVDVSKSGPWNGGTRWILARCPFNFEHVDSAYIVQLGNGAIGAGCHHNSCQSKSWHDFRDVFDPEWHARSTGPSYGSFSRGPGTSEEIWPAPDQLPDELSPVAAFLLWLLPEPFQAWIKDIAERMQCPPDFPAVAAMVGLASIVGRKIGIRPKRHDDWLVIANLWGGVIGRPGVLKTPAMQEPLKPLKRLEIEAKKEFQKELKEYEAKRMVAEACEANAAKAIRAALAKGGDGLDIAAQVVDNQPQPPVRRRYLVNDATVEKLGEILGDNPNGVLCFRDELIGLLRNLDKEGQEGARSFYLEAWNGDGRFTYDRIGRGTIDIEAAIISIVGAIQPGPLRGYLHHAVESTQQDDGLIQRYQLTVWPDITGEWVNVDRWPDTEVKKAAHSVYFELDALNVGDVGAMRDESDSDSIPFLRFSQDAQELFDAWREELERKLRSGGDHPAIESHLAKYRSLVPALALLIHLAENGRGPVSTRALEKAIGWASYLETHARRIYAVAVNPDLYAARALAQKIRERAIPDEFARHQVYRHGWTYLTNPDLVERAAGILVDLNWLREVTTKTGGAPKTVYRINPRIWETPQTPPEKTETSTPSDAEPNAGAPDGDSSNEGGGS